MSIPTPGSCGHQHDTTAEHAACYFKVDLERVGSWAGSPGGPWAVEWCGSVMLCPDAEEAYEIATNSDLYECGSCCTRLGTAEHHIVRLPDHQHTWPEHHDPPLIADGY